MENIHPLRLNPPDAVCSPNLMADASNPPFVVRPLPSSGLDGAFRVHLSPDGLTQLGLKLGDICQITGENGGTGYGIAWRATDKMGSSPKLRPARMNETLRTAFGFKEGAHVTITKSNLPISHADKVTLTDVTPSDYGNAAEADAYGKWRLSCAKVIADADAFAVGTTFDVTAKKGLRKRFYVEHVEGGAPAGGLYQCDDDSQVVVSDGSQVTEPSLVVEDGLPVLDTSRIGGLVEQVKELNRRLDRILSKSSSRLLSANRHIMVHGYEGTGKSLLLNRLEQTSACKVYRLEKLDMTAGKIQSTIQSTFKDAVANQPSIIIMDDIEEFASTENKLYANCIGRELDKLHGTHVLVIAATRYPTSVHSSLTGPMRLEKQIELPIPNVAARRQILNVMLGKPADADDTATTSASLKTHGFTGKDLGLLVGEAVDNALERCEIERDVWVKVQGRVQALHRNASNGQIDGSLHSQATTEVGGPQVHAEDSPPVTDDGLSGLAVMAEDFELALSSGAVRPTALREIFLETPKVQWSDIGGSEVNKQRFDEIIGWPLHHPELVEQLGLPPQKGVLLYGPPGCSKTMTAQAVATTYDLNFIAVKGAELISMYVGESERAVREVFRKARQAAPCIVFFDEIDAIGSERESGGAKGLNVLTTLLNEMDGFEAMKDVLVLAATNKPEILDPALLRPGRFDQHVYVGLPTPEARKDILKICLKMLPGVMDTMDQLVSDTEGYSGAEVVGICGLAKRVAARRKLTMGSPEVKVERSDFQEATRQTRKGVTREMLDVYEVFGASGSR